MKDIHDLEIYAPIDGFPDYLVTSHGRILTLKNNNIRELKTFNNGNGYLIVNLCKDRKAYHKLVHGLVAQAFIPNPENKPCINHIDENKSNNNISNIEWVTYKENNNHGTHNQKMSISRKGKCLGKKHPHSKSVIGFKVNCCDIKYYKYINECEEDGFHHSDISKCCKGKLKTSKGYKWYYADEFFNRKE